MVYRCTCEVLLQQVLESKEHHLVEWGTLLAPAFKVGIDLADVGRVLFVVRDLGENGKTEYGEQGLSGKMFGMKCSLQITMD